MSNIEAKIAQCERDIAELEKSIREHEHELEKLDPLSYVKGFSAGGAVVAIAVFFLVGSWYDKVYGFDGSAGAAFCAAIFTIIVFAAFGMAVYYAAGRSHRTAIDRANADILKYHQEIATLTATFADGDVERALVEKFSKNSFVMSVIDKISDMLMRRIESAYRGADAKVITASVGVRVSKDSMSYGSDTYAEEKSVQFDSAQIRLRPLTDFEERKALIRVIAKRAGITVNDKLKRDGKTEHRITVTYKRVYDEVQATIIYERDNPDFRELGAW